LAHWYGKVEGDLHVGGEFTDFASGSQAEADAESTYVILRGSCA
jgi:hypothetical protein